MMTQISNDKLVSVVLPTFNGEKYLAESIESVLSQTYGELELIIIDDCSTDSTPQVAERFACADHRVRLHRNVTNQRLPRSLNIGFALARGRYLTWTSDDNLYRSCAIEKMAGFLEASHEFGLVYASQTVIDDNGVILAENQGWNPDHLPFGSTVGACFLYRRQVMEQVGDYDPEMFLAEDHDYILRIATRFKIAKLDEDLYLYRSHDASLTGKYSAGEVRRVVDRAAAKSLPGLFWVPSHDKARAYEAMLRRSENRRDDRFTIQLLTGYMRCCPGQFIRFTASKALRATMRRIGFGSSPSTT